MAPSAASKVDASVAYPGYAKQRRRVEAQIRRARPGPSSLSRAFAVLARVLLATLLLPFDLLLGDALRTGRLARPAMGAAGAALAFFAVHFINTAGPNGGRLQQRLDPDPALAYYRPVEIPHWLDACELEGFPFASRFCERRGSQARTLYGDGAVEVLELAGSGAKQLRVDGATRATYDPRSGRLGEARARAIVRIATGWRPPFAGGERPARVLVLGLGHLPHVVAGIHEVCHERSSKRHRRAGTGEVGCRVDAVEADPDVARVVTTHFLDARAVGGGGGGFGNGFGIGNGNGGGSFERGADAASSSTEASSAEARASAPVVRLTAASSDDVRVLVDSPADFVRRVARPGDYDVVVIDPLVDPETTRSAAFARDCRRLLTAGGLYVIAGVSAPAFFGPGSGRAELEAWTRGIAEAFGEEHVATERAGPPTPWFPRATLIVATKALDPEVARYHNWA